MLSPVLRGHHPAGDIERRQCIGMVHSRTITHHRPPSRQTTEREVTPAAPIRPLQHFEFRLMLAVNQHGTMAYPAELARFLTKSLGRHVSLAQVFVALERLEDRGLVSSVDVTPDTPARGGRRRRVFTVEPDGTRAIRMTTAAFDRSASRVLEKADERQEGRREHAPA